MISGKFLWFVLVQFAIFKECNCFNTTQKVNNEIAPLNTTRLATTEAAFHIVGNASTTVPIKNSTLQEPTLISSTIINETKLEILEIFHGNSTPATTLPTEKININSTTLCLNATFVDLTCTDPSRNDTFKTNYTLMTEAAGTANFNAFRLSNTAAIAAGVFLVSAVIGYISCVGYRRIKQRKYGNSQILIGEEVYDTADLRYFEI